MNRIDSLNIGLMLISLVLAFVFPFELFLLAYAILGPLHYLTEINWLERKSFFVKSKKWIWSLVIITLVVALPIMLVKFSYTADSFPKEGFVNGLRDYGVALAFTALIVAIVLTITKKWWAILLTLLIAFALGQLLSEYRSFLWLCGVLLPSIFHVFIFTFFFMLYGALKSKSNLGLFSSFLLLSLPLLIYIIPIDIANYSSVSMYFKQSYDASQFSNLNYGLGWLLGLMKEGEYYPVISEVGVKIQIFIAFAYTYHYLNWFSKTTVIGWHKLLSKKRFALIMLVWALSLYLYYHNYYTGFLLLLFLSYLHVLLEFPLNVTSVKEIVKSLYQRNS